MKCQICGKKIPYDGNIEFISITKYEMVYGEQSIYPMEQEKGIVCSLQCLRNFCDRNLEATK